MFHLDVSKVDLGFAHVAMATTHVSTVSSVFRLMLQVFHLDVSKIYFSVARVAMATHACFKCFIVCFHIYVVDVSSGCFKSISGVACRRPPAAAGAPPWFTCRRLRPADASARA